jgi:hypothetical protein
LATQFEGCLLPPPSNSIVITHIVPHLPRTPLMLWHLHQMNKMWFKVVGKSLPWNALEMVKLDHKCYLNYIRKHGTERQSFQTCFELEFLCATNCLTTIDIYLNCDSNMYSKKDPKLGLQTPRYNENSPHICHATLMIGHQWKNLHLVFNSICDYT